MGLKQYNAKRDFSRTEEPPGSQTRLPQSRSARFVVQKHAASHLHYDFRLEMEGVLRSWAVPKGFPFKRGDRRLAVEVEDHPMEYGGFEGTIPAGNYGAGTVMLWDRGRYSVLEGDAVTAWKKGKIHLTLQGKKLRGEWTLVRMRRPDASKPQWLLLKSKSDLPSPSKKAEDQSILTNRSMDEIAGSVRRREWKSSRKSGPEPSRSAMGHSRMGATVAPHSGARSQGGGRTAAVRQGLTELKNLNLEALPPRKPEFVQPMKAQLVDSLPKGEEWLYEIKFDGVRALAIKNGRSMALISRSGKDFGGKYDRILTGLQDLAAEQVILDGEVVAVDTKGRSSFQLLQSYQSGGAEKPPLVYYVFDVIQFEGKDMTGLPLTTRKLIAEQLVQGRSDARFSGSIKADSSRIQREMRARGLEGLIAKKRSSSYEPGRRSGSWVKFKWTNEQEFVIGGYTRPQGSRSHFGAILVGYYAGERLLFAAKVGTGFAEETLMGLRHKFEKRIQPECPFANLPERTGVRSAGLGAAEMRRCTWLKPELVCQVRFAEWTRDGHLRQPAYLGLREDKPAREVQRESPKSTATRKRK
jgi:bifunctional non-homologous end joining protein LigD